MNEKKIGHVAVSLKLSKRIGDLKFPSSCKKLSSPPILKYRDTFYIWFKYQSIVAREKVLYTIYYVSNISSHFSWKSYLSFETSYFNPLASDIWFFSFLFFFQIYRYSLHHLLFRSDCHVVHSVIAYSYKFSQISLLLFNVEKS